MTEMPDPRFLTATRELLLEQVEVSNSRRAEPSRAATEARAASPLLQVIAAAGCLIAGVGLFAVLSGHPSPPTGHPAPPSLTHSALPSSNSAPAIPVPSPGVTADAAAQAKAKRWMAGARVPPGAVEVDSPPPGTTINDQWQNWWCQPMAEQEAYWKVPGMNLGRAANWLRAHPSNGLHIVGDTFVPPNPVVTNDAVYDFPSPGASEGMTFNVASWGQSGAVIHLQIGVLSKNSVCASAPPGSELGTAGG